MDTENVELSRRRINLISSCDRQTTISTASDRAPEKTMQDSGSTVAGNGVGAGRVLWLQFIFLASGIAQTCLVNLVSYHGAASPSTLLPVFVSYLAMATNYFLASNEPTSHTATPSTEPSPHKRKTPLHHVPFKLQIMSGNEIKIMLLAFYDLICCIAAFLSLIYSGSAVFQLVYSSIIIITATFRHFLLPNKKLSLHQWIACCIVTFGLLLSGFGQNTHDSHHTVLAAFQQLLWPLLTTMLYAFEYVLIEKVLQSENAPTDNELCYKMGFYGLCVICGYQIMNVIPNWNDVFIHEIYAQHGSGWVIWISYLAIFMANFLHNWSYFKLLHNSGAVSTGINQALRAVGVFVISGIFFCELQESQCFNSFKLLSLIVVIIGVLRYVYITAMYQHKVNKNGELYIISIEEQHKHLV